MKAFLVEATGKPGPVYTTALNGEVYEFQILSSLPVEPPGPDSESELEDGEEPFVYTY